MHILIAILLILLFQVTWAQEKTKNDIRSTLQQEIKSMNQEIDELKKKIFEAKKNNEIERANELQEELDQLTKTISIMKSGMEKLESVPTKTIDQIEIEETNAKKVKANKLSTLNPKALQDGVELTSHLSKIFSSISSRISKEGERNAINIINQVNAKYKNIHHLANVANGLWMTGYREEAVYVAAKASLSEPDNNDNLNNLSAFLIMIGEEDAAIPILLNLEKKFPNNTTILNNIGQAWFAMGNITKSEKYLDKAISVYDGHSQANLTKGLIQESNHNTNAAMQSFKKSIRTAYAPQKANKIKKLKGSLENRDIKWNFPMKEDALGLKKIAIPPSIKDVDNADELNEQWKAFYHGVSKKIDELNEKSIPLKELFDKRQEQEDEKLKKVESIQQSMDFKNANDIKKKVAAMRAVDFLKLPPLFWKTLAKKTILAEEINRKKVIFDNRAKEISEKQEFYHQQFVTEVKNLPNNETWDGEMLEDRQFCGLYTPIASKYLTIVNTMWEQYYSDKLQFYYRIYNLLAYYALFDSPEDLDLQLELLAIQIGFLNMLPVKQYYLQPCNKKEIRPHPDVKLPDFDDIHCLYKTEIWVIFSTFKIECNKMTTEYNFLFVEGKHKENLNTNEILYGDVQIGIVKSLGSKSLGPMAAEFKVNAGIFLEYDNNGITDFGPKGGVKYEVGLEIPESDDPLIIDKENKIAIGDWPFSLERGFELKCAWNAGPSLYFKK